MSVDGFLMGNLGLTAELSSAQIAGQAEHLAKKESEIKIKDPEAAEKDTGVKRKKEEEQAKQEFDDGLSEKDDETSEEETQSNLTEQDIENAAPKEFTIRINQKTEMAELFNNKTEKVVETISAESLMHIMSKLDNASGILVNRKV